MKTSDKIQYIEYHLQLFNRTIFKNKNYYLTLIKMTPKYCIRIVNTKHDTLSVFKYNTYDDIITTIDLMKFMFTKNTENVKMKERIENE